MSGSSRRHHPLLRRARSDDLPRLEALLAEAHVQAAWFELLAPRAQELAGLEEAGGAAWVATRGGELLGVALVRRQPSPRLQHVAGVWVAVAEAYQGRGVGRALLDHGLDHAARWQAVLRFEARVLVDNARALRLFRGAGFAAEGVARAAALADARMMDVYCLGRVAPIAGWARFTAEQAENPRPPQLPGATPVPRRKKRDLPN